MFYDITKFDFLVFKDMGQINHAGAINDAYCSRSLATFRQHSLPIGKLDVDSIICAPFFISNVGQALETMNI